ncbi:ABC transporter permease [Jatrophihabitans cynanchi]|jgi:peptide/nickel transport system permease protein|uniref:ABC transporter permease n=1 Tax=Jatrophihabitans cynanchi TaxID=2944128 RepID=A0ABY7K097_9ACTN|nr:ABC transporter permease [Jatrophihabitans sp. SB3-54]WAX58268.1 ABC transporter permease [Jatrophihabitans sp. SB3-54]
MGRYLVQRIGQGLIVIIGVVTVVFVVTRVVGDPAKVMLPLTSTAAQRKAFDHQLGLDKPLIVQYFDFWKGILHGNFGESYVRKQPALHVALDYLPATLELVFVGMAIAFVLAVTIGVIAALRPGRLLDRAVTFVSLIGLSVPQFWLGLLLIILFGVKLGWFPVSGRDGATAIVLPAITLAAPTTGRTAMVVRSSMIDELNKQYVLTAEAKGLSAWRRIGVHTLRNALAPAVTLFGWDLVRALAGFDVVVEVVFGWTGIGHLAYDSILGQDFTELQAIVILVAILVVIINICMDMVYRLIDPRVKVGA